MDVGAWLASLGLQEYQAAFLEARVDLSVLPELTDQDLRELGVSRLGDRRHIQSAARQLRGDRDTRPPLLRGEPTERPGVITTPPLGMHLPDSIDGHVVEGMLGMGRGGAVYRVRDPSSRQSLALKTRSLPTVGDDDLRRRFKQHYDTLRGLRHPSLVQVLGCGEDPVHGLYYTMELMEGGALPGVVRSENPGADRCFLWWEKLAKGLLEAHRAGVLHLDIKPQNVLFGATGTPVLVDWNLGGATPMRPTSPATRVWSPSEMLNGESGPFTDVYGLAAILLWLLTGELPEDGRGAIYRLLAIRGLRSPGLAEALETGLTGQRYRFASVEKLARAVQQSAARVVAEAPGKAEGPTGDLAGDLGAVPPTIKGFTFQREETFSCGGQIHRVKIYRHDGLVRALGVEKAPQAMDTEFVLVPGGPFWMGSPNNEGDRDEHPRHLVTVPSFLLARTPVTQRAWQALSHSAGVTPQPSAFHGELRPVENVSWAESRRWCDAAGLRLPTEAEWEYACRAGTTTRYFFGNSPSDLDAYAWSSLNSDGVTHHVGRVRPNAFGLTDMHGNVWEPCADMYDTYVDAPADGSAALARLVGTRVIRGGSWYLDAAWCRSADRSSIQESVRSNGVGCRAAMSLEQA